MTENRPKIAIHDLETGKNIVRDMTDDELAQHEIDMARYAEETAELEAKESLKASARAKLVAGLPMTAEEAATLIA